MRWLKSEMVLASGGFFVIISAIGVFVGTGIVAKLDEREVARGEKVHDRFTVVAEPGEGREPFRSLGLVDVLAIRARGDAVSFLMSVPNASKGPESSPEGRTSFRVLEDNGSEQVIEVVFSTDDIDVWSRYRATRSTVTPISSRMFVPGYMFAAIPFALGFALVLNIIGRILRRKAGFASDSSAGIGEKTRDPQ